MTPPEPKPAPAPRVASLDQFRGYTVAGMLLVNYMGRFKETPAILDHHNTYCSYADTIMPQFFLAVGCAYRLTFMKRLAAGGGMAPAVAHAIRRNLGLFLLAVVYYGLDGEVRNWDDLVQLGLGGVLRQGFQRTPFQTLAIIAMTSVWVLPVIGRSVRAQVLYAAGSAVLYAVLSKLFYFDWAWGRPVIDGGPLSFLSWTTPLLAGSVAFDWISKRGPRGALAPLFLGGAALMAIGYGVSCLGGAGTAEGAYGFGLAAPPFTPPEIPVNLWTMSQRTGSVSYLTFAAGFGMAVLGLFVVLCDLIGMRVGVFRTFGSNALITYVTHMLIFGTFRAYAPADSPLLYASLISFLSGWVTYIFIRHLEKTGCFVRL